MKLRNINISAARTVLKLYSPLLVGFFLLLMFALVSCSEEERIKLIEDNFTDNQPISGLAAVEQDPIITEGNNLFMQGDFKQAIEKYEEGLKVNRAVAFYNIGVSYYLLGEIDKSEEYFRKAVEDDPKFTEAYINLAVVLLQTDKLDEAEIYTEELLKHRATGKLLVNMANIYLKKGETARASVLYEDALRKDGKSRFVRSNYAYFLLSIGEFNNGIEIIESLEYKDYTDYYNLGTAYYLTGDYRESVANLILALRFEENQEVLELLARDYEKLQSYSEEANILKRLVELDPSQSHRYRFAIALYKSGMLSAAHENMTELINEFPKEYEYYIIDYKILTALEEYAQAGNVIAKGYREINNDALMYLYVKYLIIHEDKSAEARRIIYSRGSSPYVSLAKAMYEIHSGNMLPAQKYLDQVPPATNNDYYVFRAYIMMKYRDYAGALEVTKLIDKLKPEYFWYRTVNLWNLKRIQELQMHFRDALANDLRTSRHPNITIHIDPVLEDFDLSYTFDGDFEDIVESLLYPLLIEPDEMLTFVAFGYKLLQQNEKILALEELQKSVKFSNGIAHNNKGVTLFLAYAYEDALREFLAAEKLLGTNPYTLYNIGLVHLAMGRTLEAEKYFDDSVTQNRYNFPAYLGKAVTLKLKGDPSSAYQEYNLVRDRAADVKDDREKVPNIIYFTKYFADMGVGDYRTVINDLGKRKQEEGFMSALYAIAEYLSGQGFNRLDPLKSDKIFRGSSLRDLIAINTNHEPDAKPNQIIDRFYKFMRTYLSVKDGHGLLPINYEQYLNDKVILKEMIYYHIFMLDSRLALYYLQRLNSIDLRDTELYKASLYYFIWLGDFVNAEASLMVLERMGFNDKYFSYYKMLYFLLNYHEERLMTQINSYRAAYPNDFRWEAIKLMIGLKNDSIRTVYNEMGELEAKNGNFLLNLPLELEIDGL